MSVDKLILGTAGLGGLPYGRNKRVLSEKEAARIIEYALEHGIYAFDTAPAYGFAEKVLGETLRKYHSGTALNNELAVFTKNNGDKDQALASLKLLAPTMVHFLYHNLNKDLGAFPPYISGATIYNQDWEKDSIEGLGFEYVQTNWNLLTQSFPCRKIIARSIFLQGVLADGECQIPDLEPHIKRCRSFADSFGLSLPQLALHAALCEEGIEHVVIGPTSIGELKECIKIASKEAYGFGPMIRVLDLGYSSLTDPRKWAA